MRRAKSEWWYQEDLIEKAISEKNCKELGLPISKYKHISVYDGEGTLVAYCGCHDKTLANAQVIAAAPALLAVLEAMKLRISFIGWPSEPMNEDGPDWSKEIALLEAAIANTKLKEEKK